MWTLSSEITFFSLHKKSNENNSYRVNFLTAVSKTCQLPPKIDHPYPIWLGTYIEGWKRVKRTEPCPRHPNKLCPTKHN